jgi:serine-type D-Ala-D-Ala endopeptidase (penicillin-binding protein 7)
MTCLTKFSVTSRNAGAPLLASARHALVLFTLALLSSALYGSNAFAQVAAKPNTQKANSSSAKASASKAPKTTKTAKSSAVSDFTKDGMPNLLSHAAMVFDPVSGRTLYSKNADTAVPIASITKLMTAMVVLDAKQNLDDPVMIDNADLDTLKNTRSRLPVGTAFRREDLMRLSLMASDNRAAHALGRTYPGGLDAALEAMNAKAKSIGLTATRFVDPTGLAPGNVASPQDLAIMVAESARYAQIREFSTATELYVTLPNAKHAMGFNNTNALVKSDAWNIGVSKTGFINEAGKCLVMQAIINNSPVVIVLMDSWGRLTRIGDANRIKRWIESGKVALGAAARPPVRNGSVGAVGGGMSAVPVAGALSAVGGVAAGG